MCEICSWEHIREHSVLALKPGVTKNLALFHPDPKIKVSPNLQSLLLKFSLNFSNTGGCLCKLFTFYPKWKLFKGARPTCHPLHTHLLLSLFMAQQREAAACRPTGSTGRLAEHPLVGYKAAPSSSLPSSSSPSILSFSSFTMAGRLRAP